MSIALILTLLSSFAPLLQKYVGTTGESLISTGLTALGNLIAAWTSHSPAAELQAALATLQAVLADLAKDPSTDPATMAQIEEVTKDIEAAVAAFEAAEAAVDPAGLVVPPAVS
jgi:hypothetical protein